jgi:hypothetical protein
MLNISVLILIIIANVPLLIPQTGHVHMPSFLLDEAEAFSSRVTAFCLEGTCHPDIRVCVSRLSTMFYSVIDTVYISYRLH